MDAVEEFRVIATNISAEYGGRMGSRVILSLKSGTNQLQVRVRIPSQQKLDGTTNLRLAKAAVPPESVRRGRSAGRFARTRHSCSAAMTASASGWETATFLPCRLWPSETAISPESGPSSIPPPRPAPEQP